MLAFGLKLSAPLPTGDKASRQTPAAAVACPPGREDIVGELRLPRARARENTRFKMLSETGPHFRIRHDFRCCPFSATQK